MSKQLDIQNRRLRAKNRVRATISGTAKRPRLNVTISLTNVTAQLIDDTTGKTLVWASTIGNKDSKGKNLTAKAELVATQLAKLAKEKKIVTVVFDRGRRRYHGRIKAFATAARTAGLKF
jgi:large subunit ribosomal protein L18